MSTYLENDIDITSKAVTKILRQTQEGEISWKVDSRESFLGLGEHLTEQIYMTVILDKNVRIYKFYKSVKDSYTAMETNFESAKLQIIDNEGKPEWDFPYSNAINDLYKAISIKTFKVKEFLDKWLNE
jgi:hypothetical protein